MALTASVTMTNPSPLDRGQFRELEAQHYAQAAVHEPASVSASLKNLGLGHVELRPPPARTGLYVGLGIAILLSIPLMLIVIGIMYLALGPLPAAIAA